jgi:hypothetical protein
MPDISDLGFVTKDPTAYTSTLIGTAVGTTTISKSPGFLFGLLVPVRVASANYVLYDSDGTSSSVIGTITLGTQTFSDPPPTYQFRRVFNKLTVASTVANAGAIVLWK